MPLMCTMVACGAVWIDVHRLDPSIQRVVCLHFHEVSNVGISNYVSYIAVSVKRVSLFLTSLRHERSGSSLFSFSLLLLSLYIYIYELFNFILLYFFMCMQ